MFTVLELFAGIGGMSLGLEAAGMTVVGQVEIDPYCRSILDHHWPKVPRHDDVRTTIPWWRSQPRPHIDLVAGGFPCQSVSALGAKRAQDDPRWLWPAMAVVIDDLRPPWVLVENVRGLAKRGLHLVLADLHDTGYRTHTATLTACAVGAPHMRTRLFIVAHPQSVRCQIRPTPPRRPRRPASGGETGGPGRDWPTEPAVGRLVDGFPGRLAQLQALGNAVVPAAARHIGELILTADPQDT
jgi:DNA (cytosine-5)-methyltransferase 1